MKIVVSYISSIYNSKKTIDEINKTSADGIHVDLMDGIYAGKKNFEIDKLNVLFKDNNKPLDVHMMISEPLLYLEKIIKLNPDCIYIHPKTVKGLISVLKLIDSNAIKRGIVINPEEDISEYEYIFPYVDRVLLMSVKPGMGGQLFIDSTIDKLNILDKFRNKYNFKIYVDGGINDKTIKYVNIADGVVSGSFICNSSDYEKQIETLRK